MTVPHLPVGSFVRFWPNAEHVGEGRLTRTTSQVEDVCGEPFVSIDCVSGMVPLRHLEVVSTWSGDPHSTCGPHEPADVLTWCRGCHMGCSPTHPCLGCEVVELRDRVAELEHKTARYRLGWQSASRGRAERRDLLRKAAQELKRYDLYAKLTAKLLELGEGHYPDDYGEEGA